LIQVCRDFAGTHGQRQSSDLIYLFIERFHGKSTMAKAIETEARSGGLAVLYFDGTIGSTQNSLRLLQAQTDALTIVDGLPEPAASRRVLLQRFNSLAGKGLLLSPPEYCADANLDSDIPRLRLDHVDQRPIDKISWLIGLVRESLRDAGLGSEDISQALGRLPVRGLTVLSRVKLGPKIADLASLASRVAEALQVRPEEVLSQEELTGIFLEFFSPTLSDGDERFRLWVEGESDCRALRLVARLGKKDHGLDLEEGLLILPLGEGREGGTSKAYEVVLLERTRKNRDVFLLDFDDPGRHAKEELEILKQDVVLLDPRISCTRSQATVEIEDFISLSCLDRFYEAKADLRPEEEIIRYKSPASRRLVVNGEDKETLLDWLEANASLPDLENLFFLLCEIRSRFSLRNPFSQSEIAAWKKRLLEESNPSKQLGSRPRHWS
jgi:hypothetical protein